MSYGDEMKAAKLGDEASAQNPGKDLTLSDAHQERHQLEAGITIADELAATAREMPAEEILPGDVSPLSEPPATLSPTLPPADAPESPAEEALSVGAESAEASASAPAEDAPAPAPES